MALLSTNAPARTGAALLPTPTGLRRLDPRVWIALSRQRRQLAELDDHMLADIGVSRDEALDEAARAGWQVPAQWMR